MVFLQGGKQRMEGEETGVGDWTRQKPFTLEALTKKVRKVLNNIEQKIMLSSCKGI